MHTAEFNIAGDLQRHGINVSSAELALYLDFLFPEDRLKKTSPTKRAFERLNAYDTMTLETRLGRKGGKTHENRTMANKTK